MQQPPGRCSEEVADRTESERERRMRKGRRRSEQRRRRRRVMGGKQAEGRQHHALAVVFGSAISPSSSPLYLSMCFVFLLVYAKRRS